MTNPAPSPLVLGTRGAPPAMDDNGPSVRRGRGLHAPDEGQQPCGVVGDAMLWPRGEVELADLVPGRVASLQRQSQSLRAPPQTPARCPATTASILPRDLAQCIPIINGDVGVRDAWCPRETRRQEKLWARQDKHYPGVGPGAGLTPKPDCQSPASASPGLCHPGEHQESLVLAYRGKCLP